VKWDLSIVADTTAGRRVGDAEVARVVVDSREAGPGDLFVAIRGERHDGHEFVAEATANGAALLVEAGRLPAGGVGVEVDDTLAALSLLAARRRGEIIVPVVAITGSNGKTTTKDLTAAALGSGAHAAPRSFNNEVGVPLTLLGTPDEAATVVVEVGSRGIGHITALGQVIRPDVAVITNIGRAHLEMFGDLDTVLRAKWELIEILGAGGVAVLPSTDERLTGRHDGPRITFGEDAQADVAVSEVSLDRWGRASFVITHAGHRLSLTMAPAGRHQPLNAAAAVGASLALGVPFEDAARRTAAATLSPWRMEVVERPVAGGTVVVVNDAYNANPDSMEAAFSTVEAMPGRHIAVLGKMHELGASEAELHRAIGRAAIHSGFDTIVVVGEDPGMAAGAGERAVAVADVTGAVSELGTLLRPGDIVLIKGSRAAGLEGIADAIGGGPPA
jgi:UDP-N-acetylmuramoyl-tripeptide--D-alanyl-D-alanine ligase